MKINKKSKKSSLDHSNFINSNLKGAERIFAILRVIGMSPSRVIDIKEKLNIPWTTAHRVIKNLEKSNFIKFNAKTKRYEIGSEMWYIGSSYLFNNSLLTASLKYLSTENKIKNVDIQIVERIGNNSVVIHAEKKQREKIPNAQYGFHLPLHAGSRGLILLAFEKKDFIKNYLKQNLKKLTPETQINKVVIKQKIEEIQKLKIFFSVGDVQKHTASVASPVFDENKNILGCVCFVFLRKHYKDKEFLKNISEKIKIMTMKISSELGYK